MERRLNPLVDRYVTTDLSFLEIARAAASREHPLVRALMMIEESLQGKRLARDAIGAARDVQIKGSDPELMILMLSSWANLSSTIGRPSDTEALIHRANAMVSDATHALVRAHLLLAEATLADVRGNKARGEKLLRGLLELVPEHSPRRKFYVWELALFLALQGRGIEFTDEVRALTWKCNERFDITRILLIQFLNAVETGKVQEASSLMPRIATTATIKRHLRRIPYRGYQLLLFLMHHADDPAYRGGEPQADGGDAGTESSGRAAGSFRDAPGTPDWIRVVDRLLRRDTAGALQLARDEVNRMLSSIMGSGFDSFSLVRAELAAGNAEAARHLLTMRRGRGNRHYLDDLFLARANLLEDNPTSAAADFAKVLQATDFYQARERLDFELKLACELSQGDVRRLTQAAASHVQEAQTGPATAESASGTERRQSPAAKAPRRAPDRARMTNELIGRSPDTLKIRETVLQFADLDAPILITGETGTGKDLVARMLHRVSRRSERPFTAVNCSSITETLLESELFGYERGAFTGAERTTQGLFEATGDGTIFLDEIGDISPGLQQALLRVLETGEFRPVGSTKTRTIRCRILAATNADLQARANAGTFRRDLLYRLQRLVIHIPPLRERPNDILPLVRNFLDVGRRVGSHASLSPQLVDAIKEYDWPGNVRELKNVVERMRLMHSDKLAYDLGDLDLKLQPTAADPPGATPARRPAPPRDENHTPPLEAREAAGARPAPPPPRIDALLKNGRSRLRRRDRLRELFRTYKKMTRGEIVQILSVAPNTATKDLKALCEEGVIRRVEPSASTRTHYFELT